MTLTIRSIIAALSLIMALRGVDYLSNELLLIGTNRGEIITMPEVWGVACLVVAGFGLFSVWKRTLLTAVNFGVVGAAVNAMMAFQFFQIDMLPYPWPPEDIRILGDSVGTVVLFLIVALSSAHRNGVNKRKLALVGELNE